MKSKIFLITLANLSVGLYAYGQEEPSLEEFAVGTTDGITFTEGTYYPTYSIQGMEYDPELKAYVPMPTEGSGESGPQTNSGVPPAPSGEELIGAYRTAEDRVGYFAGLAAPSQAAAFSAATAGERTAILTEQNWIKTPPWYYQPVLMAADLYNGTGTVQSRDAFHSFMTNLSAADVASALGSLGSQGTGLNWGKWSGVNLSAYTGFPNKYLSGADFSGAIGLTANQVINSGTYLVGANFVGTGITQEMAQQVISEKGLSDQASNFREVTWDNP